PGGGYIQGVSVDFSDVGVVVTDADGYYEQAVPAGWSGRATPSKACLEFLPTHRDYVNVTSHIPNQHYEGSVAQYTISGQVINSAGAGIPDVHMTGFPGEVYTNPDGFYQGTIPCGWSGTITPVLECWGFSPTGRTYSDVRDDQTGQNFLAIPATFTLSGWVRDATGAPMPGVSMNGLPCGEVITDPTGFYRCAVPCGWSGIVTPVLQDCSFTPPSRNYVNVRTSIPDQDYVGECGPPSCDPGFELVDTQAGTGGVAGVRIVANGMQTMPIGGLEFHIDYPPSCMSCTEVVSDYLTAPTVNCGSGEVHIVWDDFANPITVPDGDVIAVILFDVLGNTGDVCDVCWAQGNEVVDPFGDPIGGLGYCCGTVTVEESDRCISGNVVYYDMVKKMPDVTVVLSPGGTTATDAAGHYEFCGLAPGNYTVKPVHGNNDPGVSVGDVIKIRRHLAVLEPFTSGYQLIAADVTCDCNVSVSDIIKIRRFLAVLDTLPCGNWQFVDSSYNVTTTDWCPVPDEINALLTNFDQTDSSFVGVRKGDVNNTWTPSAPFASSRQDDNLQATAGALALKLEDAHPVSNVVAIPLALGSGRIAGLELHLEYDSDHLAFTGFNSEQLSGITLNDDGSRLHLVWEDLDNVIEHDAEKQIAQIEFAVVNSSGEFTEIDITSAEVVDESGTPFVLTGRNSRVFLSDGDGLVPDGFWLGQNYPNPFNPDTDIDFYLPQQSDVTLAVYNMLGQQVRVLVSSSLTSGTHTAHWDGRDESGRAVSSGIYLYRLHANEFIDSHKMLMLK
ncbi:MAG: T9SS type A sorting domain-containing protein, partial [candidate division Zixibacteria bacterium]|nr:T9SS type A sorting domain-containing protein [candidate division Zixibacteria bacterium]